MVSYDSRLLTPPREEEEIAPYYPVWRSIIIQSIALLGIAGVLVVAKQFLGIEVPERFTGIINIVLCMLPAAIWMIFTYFPEQNVPLPRERLLAVFLVSALATSGVVIPLLNEVFQAERWLSLGSTADRIIGYMFTSGMVHASATYLLLRFIVWPDHIRTRIDGIAYAAAIATGSVTVNSLYLITHNTPLTDVLAADIFAHFGFMLVVASTVGFGVAESKLSNARAIFVPISMLMGALIMGIAIPIRASLINAGFTIAKPEGLNIPAISDTNAVFGLAFSTIILTSLLIVIAFFMNNAEHRQRQLGAKED